MIHSAEQFVSLRSSTNPEEYLRAARDEAPLAVWLEVISRFPDMRKWVAGNKTVPQEVLEILQRDPDPEVRTWVATKNKLSYESFALLANDPSYSVRSRIVYNKKIPSDILLQLENDPDPMIALTARTRRTGSHCD
jgi:hypothetical protein